MFISQPWLRNRTKRTLENLTWYAPGKGLSIETLCILRFAFYSTDSSCLSINVAGSVLGAGRTIWQGPHPCRADSWWFSSDLEMNSCPVRCHSWLRERKDQDLPTKLGDEEMLTALVAPNPRAFSLSELSWAMNLEPRTLALFEGGNKVQD